MNNKKIAVLATIITIVIIAIGVVLYFVLRDGDKKDDSDPKDKNNNEESSTDFVDAEQFYNEYSQEVTATDATDPEKMLDEKSAYNLLNERGICGSSITAAYTENGEYYGETEIRADSEDKHPVYQTQYSSENGDEWLIMIIGKSVMACPITFVSLPGDDIPILVSETNTVTGYDNISGKFYDTIPKETVLKIIQVEVVNATSLDSIAEEASAQKE